MSTATSWPLATSMTLLEDPIHALRDEIAWSHRKMKKAPPEFWIPAGLLLGRKHWGQKISTSRQHRSPSRRDKTAFAHTTDRAPRACPAVIPVVVVGRPMGIDRAQDRVVGSCLCRHVDEGAGQHEQAGCSGSFGYRYGQRAVHPTRSGDWAEFLQSAHCPQGATGKGAQLTRPAFKSCLR